MLRLKVELTWRVNPPVGASHESPARYSVSEAHSSRKQYADNSVLDSRQGSHACNQPRKLQRLHLSALL